MEDNKQHYQDYVKEFIQNGDESVIGHYVDNDVLTHNGMPGQAPGIEGVKQTFRILRAAFPDLQAEIKDIIGEGDKVVGRFVVSGTHTGDFMGTAGTGKKFTYGEIVIVRFKDGKIVEHWAEMDTLGMMQQLGIV